MKADTENKIYAFFNQKENYSLVYLINSNKMLEIRTQTRRITTTKSILFKYKQDVQVQGFKVMKYNNHENSNHMPNKSQYN